MPELPEVETVVRGLRPILLRKRLQRIILRRPDLRWPIPADLGQRLTGAEVTAIERRAKYGLIATSRGDTLIFHLGMSGRFVQLDASRADDAGRHDHVLLQTDDTTLAYRDPRRFGSLHLVPSAQALDHPLLRQLGPEPLSDDFSAAMLIRTAKVRKTSMKALLLDQRVVAGLGNIYVCEALFAAGIHPTRTAGEISTSEITKLVAEVKSVLHHAIQAGGSTLRDHATLSGAPGYFQMQFQVYGREGQSCGNCGTPVQRMTQSGRSSFYCPHCQT